MSGASTRFHRTLVATGTRTAPAQPCCPESRDIVIDTDRPIYVPLLLPNDVPVLRQVEPMAAGMISAVCHGNPRLAELAGGARARCDTLLVDPKTPHFQFEGYMSMPDYRALPYSPGQGALGTLWQPARFARRAARAELIEAVFAVQRELGAGLLLAPYFYVPHHEHRWLQVSRDCAREALSMSPGAPVGIPLSIDIDALIEPDHRAHIAAAYADLETPLFWVTIVNYDERRADPRDARTVVAFLQDLQATGAAVVLSHTGRTGLLAIARGAAGFAAGSHGLENHPRSFFREMMGSRPANAYYLHACLFHLGVRQAQACLQLDHPCAHPPCDCPACDGETSVARMVSRRLALHSMCRRILEVEMLAGAAAADRPDLLVGTLDDALELATALSAALAERGGESLRDGDFHYLEVVREAAGGPAATIPLMDD